MNSDTALSNVEGGEQIAGRLLAILGPVERFQEQFENEPIVKLLKEFELFSLNYFWHMATTKPLDNMARELKVVLENLLREWVTISRVCEQRLMEFREPLEEADQLAKNYYSRFKGYKASSEPDPLTYFGKIYGISRFESTTYPLISIPLYVFNSPEQWEQGLAHEIGHYIYWNSMEFLESGKIHKRLSNIVLNALDISLEDYDEFSRKSKLVEIWILWLEEAFADICGTLLVGPAYVSSALELANERGSDPELLALDDGEHPSPYLRPLIGLEALSWVYNHEPTSTQKERLSENIDKLRDEWVNKIKPSKVRNINHEFSDLLMQEIEDSVQPIVHAILGGNVNEDTGYTPTWTGASGVATDEVALGTLINYKGTWLQELETLQEERAKQMSRQEPLVEILKPIGERYFPQSLLSKNGMPQESNLFTKLVTNIQQEISQDSTDPDAELREALLALQSDWQGNTCVWRTLKLRKVAIGLWRQCD